MARGQQGLKQAAETSSSGTAQGDAEMGLVPGSDVGIVVEERWKEAGNQLVLLPDPPQSSLWRLVVLHPPAAWL